MQMYADEMQALDEIAKHYGGENWHTGGNVYVVVIPLGQHDCMGVTGEVICHYHNSKATSMDEVFYEPENDTGGFPYRLSFGRETAPHFGHVCRSKSSRTTPSAGRLRESMYRRSGTENAIIR